MARALLRFLLGLVALGGLFLPALPHWRRPAWMVWGTLFLALGAASSLLAAHRFQALREWEIWAATGLLVYTVAAQWRERWAPILLAFTYALTGLTLTQAMLEAIPGSQDRLGGIFHHPNALSTFCLMLLAVTFSRCFARGVDAMLAQATSGALLGLTLCAGSLTGSAVLAAMATFLSPRQTGTMARVALAGLAVAYLLAANFSGGLLAALALPTLLLALWVVAICTRPSGHILSATWLMVLTTCLVLIASAVLSSPHAGGQAVASRQTSMEGRLALYRCSLQMIWQAPMLGQGPAGFARSFPTQQTSVAVFSKFPHSWPLEIASEWGLPALLALLQLILAALRHGSRSSWEPARISACVLTVFLLHALTDVQTQFPYLLALAGFSLGVIASDSKADDPRTESRPTLIVRTALALTCLALLSLNLARCIASFDRALATTIAKRSQSREAQGAVQGLLASSLDLDPLDSESARLLGLSLLPTHPDLARDIASLAVSLDPQRASIRRLQLIATPPPPETAVAVYRAAIALDRVNYATFYRWLAEALCNSDKSDEALQLLREQDRVYDPVLLASLFEFRENDLSEQLVELYALKAVLEERARTGGGERDLRLALRHCDQMPPRLARLIAYLDGLGNIESIRLKTRLQHLLNEIPTPDRPAAVKTSLDNPKNLKLR